MNKDFIYVVKEYDDKNYKLEERYKVTTYFKTFKEVILFLNKREEFYKPFWDTNRIEIDIIKGDKDE